MRKIREYRCVNNHISEKLVYDNVINIDCDECSNVAKRIISAVKTTFKFADRSGMKK